MKIGFQNNIRWLKANLWVVLVMVVIVVSHKLWFTSDSPLTSGDWNYIHRNQLFDWLPFPIVWSVDNMGGLNPFFANTLVELPFRLLTNQLSFGIAERLLYLIPTILVSIIAINKLCEYLNLSSVAKSVAITVYLCATPLIIIRSGHNTLAMSYSIAPLLIYSFIKSVTTPNLTYPVFTSILGLVMCAYEPRAYYLLFFVLIIQFVFLMLNDMKKPYIPYIASRSLIAFIIVVWTVLLSSYWILPLVLSGGNVAVDILGRPLFGAGFSSLLRSFTLHHAFWNGGAYIPFVTQPVPLHFFLTPILLIAVFFISPRNMRLVPFKLLLLIGLFLGKQENPPFGSIYQFLYSHFPGFSAFREASKFYFYITLASSVMLAYLFDRLLNAKRQLFTSKWFISFVAWFLFICLLATYLGNLKPLATGEIGTLFQPRTMPDDYKILNRYLLKTANDTRVMGIPTSSRWIVRSDRFPSISYYTVFGDMPDTNSLPNIPFTSKLIQYVDTDSFEKYLDESSVRFITVPLPDTENDDNFFEYFDNDRNGFLRILEKTSLKRIDLGMKEVVLYENANYKRRVTVIDNSQIEQNVTTEFINASQYKIHLQNVRGRLTLTFREKFHPGWKLYESKSSNLFDMISQKSLMVEHTSNRLQQNEYVLNVTEYCESNTLMCEQNGNGYTVNLQIQFEPQRYALIGYFITISTLVFSGIVYISSCNRKVRHF